MHRQTNMNGTLPSERDALNALFDEHYKACLRTARRILRSREDSEDAVQTAYCAAIRALHRFRGESSFKTWIIRIVVNCCLMQLRERRGRSLVAIDNVQHSLRSEAATPEKLCYLQELQAAHTEATARLPETLHDVYAESVTSGLSFQTVADHSGITRSAAKSRLFRARKRIARSVQLVIQGRAA